LLDIASPTWLLGCADLVLCIHVCIAAFVVVGQAAIFVGGFAGVQWVRDLKFRAVHLALIVFIAAQTLLGQICPLTKLEQALRVRAGEAAYAESFSQHWLQPLIFFDAPWWTFAALHGLAALIVLGSWLLFPPAWQGPNART
jgi:Protein of Unknown function (DUF2784)